VARPWYGVSSAVIRGRWVWNLITRRSVRCARRAGIEAFGEDALIALNSVASEAARSDRKPNLPPRGRQIGEVSLTCATGFLWNIERGSTCSGTGTLDTTNFEE
jgi:hypothetical protein